MKSSNTFSTTRRKTPNAHLVVIKHSFLGHEVASFPGVPKGGFLSPGRKLLQVSLDVDVGGALALYFGGVGDVVEAFQQRALQEGENV